MARDVNAGGTFQALRERDFALLWSGQTVSSLGDGIFTIALAIVTLEVDHSPSGIALVFAARAIPSVLLALVGGVVVDRVSRRLVLLTSDAIRGVAVGVTGLVARLPLRVLTGTTGHSLWRRRRDGAGYPSRDLLVRTDLGSYLPAVLFVPGVLDPERVPNLDTSLGTETRRAGVDDTPDPS